MLNNSRRTINNYEKNLLFLREKGAVWVSMGDSVIYYSLLHFITLGFQLKHGQYKRRYRFANAKVVGSISNAERINFILSL